MHTSQSLKKGAEVVLSIEAAAFKGKGVAKEDGMAIFVPGTMPGDVVRARIIKRKKAIGRLNSLKF